MCSALSEPLAHLRACEDCPASNSLYDLACMSSDKIKQYRTGAIVVCIIVALALIYVNFIPGVLTKRVISNFGERYISLMGWPIFYLVGREFHLLGFFINIYMAVVLLSAIYFCITRPLYNLCRKKQYSIADICVLTIVIALYCSLWATDKIYGDINLSPGLEIGGYSSLYGYPVFVIVPISIGIICGFYLLVTTMSQIISRLKQ
jgi:hypothetical protein